MRMMVIGHGGHGKDFFCKFARDEFGLKFRSSSMMMCEHPFIQERMRCRGVDFVGAEHLFSIRRSFRVELEECISEWIAQGNSLAERIFAENDIYCGARRAEELHGVPIDLCVYIDAFPRLQRSDPTMKIPMSYVDVIVLNNTTKDEFLYRSRRLLSEILKNRHV